MSDQQNTPPQLWWISLIKELGIPTAICVVLLYGGWRVMEWAAAEVFQPMIVDQREASKDLRLTYKTLTEAMYAISHEVKANGDSIREIQSDVHELKQKLTK